MNRTLSLNIITPAETLLDVSGLTSVQVRLTDGGGLGILPDHAPLIAATSAGPIRYTDDQGMATLELGTGILQITENLVTIFTSGLWNEPLIELKVDDYANGFVRLTEILLMRAEAIGDDGT